MTDFFHRYVLHNIGLKLLSLALAVGLWLAVARDPLAEVAVEVPIEFHHFPENLEISSENIPQAQIRAPHDLEIEQVIPSQLRLSFDARIKRELEVHPRVIGNFASGYSIGRVIVDPP